MTSNRITFAGTLACAAATALTACGSGDNSPTRGATLEPPVLAATYSTDQIDAASTKSGVILVAGKATCAVNIYTILYNTVGGKGENTNASAAVMVPTGSASACTGARPVVEYGHGTDFNKAKNMANVTGDSEPAIVMATFAAQGYIVVAPNYTGYDRSTLPYHPFLNADAQASDMIDALRALRNGATAMGANLSGKFFLTGYSQGGYVAMVTQRAIQQSFGSEFNVAAAAPMSGPYALATFIQTIFTGTQPFGASEFTPLLVNSYQNSYGNVYAAPSDLYQPPYDTIAPGLLPSLTPATATAQLPAGTDGTYRTLFDTGTGAPFLVKSAFRAAALAGNAFTQDVQRNDALGWKPAVPVALCYGANDPVVFASNSTAATSSFTSLGASVTRYDVEDAATVPTSIANAFAATKAAISLSAGGGTAGAAAVAGSYHGAVAPFCSVLARSFFQTIAAATP